MINSVIHETILRDIVDTISDIHDEYEDTKKAIRAGKGNSFSSIAKASSDLVLVFPFMCDSTVGMETASMTAKAIERQCVSMLKLLFSACEITNAENAREYLAQFHSNINMGNMSLDDFLSIMDGLAESGDLIVKDQKVYNAIREEMRLISRTPSYFSESINSESLTDYAVLERYGSTNVLKEAKKADKQQGNAMEFFINNNKANTIKGPSQATAVVASGRTAEKKDMEDPSNLAQFYKNITDAHKNMLIDGDVKKANELMPSMMLVNYIHTDDNGTKIPSQFVCGVKCRLIPVDPVDIANRIVVKHSDKNVLMNFIRATTGEIGFVKDFLFAIDKAKVDAISQSRKGSSNKMWKVLERRSNKSKYRRYFSKSNDAAMITTLGISAELADYIKKENGIDMNNPKVARQIMEGYNLMGVVIIDEASEADKFLWDTGEGYYESISFNNLERENSGGEYKKALNLMQKMYR